MDTTKRDFASVIGFGPRVSTLYNLPMFDGWVIGGQFYATSYDEVFEILELYYKMPRASQSERPAILDRLHADDTIVWTDWTYEPIKDWWIPPTYNRVLQTIQLFMDSHSIHVDCEGDAGPMTEVIRYADLASLIETLKQTLRYDYQSVQSLH